MIHDAQLLQLRLRAQGLTNPSASSLEAVRAIVGIQAQDEPAARLSLRIRTRGITALEVAQAQQNGGLVRTWAMRGTLHLLTREDAAWLVPFLGPIFIPADRRRSESLGWDGPRTEQGLRVLREALRTVQGPLTRAEIIRLLQTHQLPAQGQAPIHLIARAAYEGLLCQGPNRGKQSTYILFSDWVKNWELLPRDTALAELARRFLSAYAPAAPQDLAIWSGCKISLARQAFALIQTEIAALDQTTGPAWILKKQQTWLDELTADFNPVHLLPNFDTYLLGYANKSVIIPPAFSRRVYPGGGWLFPVLLVAGRAAGAWKTENTRAGLNALVTPFEPLPAALLQAIEQETADLGRFLGAPAALKLLPSPKAVETMPDR